MSIISYPPVVFATPVLFIWFYEIYRGNHYIHLLDWPCGSCGMLIYRNCFQD